MFSVSRILPQLVAVCLVVLFAFVALLQTAQAKELLLPAESKDKHLGLVSCTGSTCHEATTPLPASPIKQNEVSIWTKKDEHAKAYEHLKNDLSKQIIKKLKWAKPAHKDSRCLDCHADNVPAAQRGKRFNITKGVTCEACHGGSGRWLGGHISGEEGHKFNLDNGLYPTEKPIQRAKLCLSCHFGTEKKFVTHEIMGAGHPRISFELDRFTNVQPAHFVRDKDYGRRKGYANGAQVWAIGQAVAVGLFLDQLELEIKKEQNGVFPELSLFDCQSCHHAMKNQRWTGGKGLPPGVIRINEANLVLLRHAIKILSLESGKKFAGGLKQLHQATMQNKQAVQSAIEALRRMTGGLVTEFANHRFTASDKRKLLQSIVAEGKKGQHADYMVAEQSVMALDTISKSLSLKLKLQPLYDLFGGDPKASNEDKISFTREKMEAYKNALKAIQLK